MHRLYMPTEPLTANSNGIIKLKLMRVSSKMRIMAVMGIFCAAARKAVAPIRAKAPNGELGHKRFQSPPSITASNAPLASDGVNNPP